jgi:hypothetical protein
MKDFDFYERKPLSKEPEVEEAPVLEVVEEPKATPVPKPTRKKRAPKEKK